MAEHTVYGEVNGKVQISIGLGDDKETGRRQRRRLNNEERKKREE